MRLEALTYAKCVRRARMQIALRIEERKAPCFVIVGVECPGCSHAQSEISFSEHAIACRETKALPEPTILSAGLRVR